MCYLNYHAKPVATLIFSAINTLCLLFHISPASDIHATYEQMYFQIFQQKDVIYSYGFYIYTMFIKC